jgi:alkylation response protein AidB-like acyl-CoA dehydrogenase
MDFTPNEDQRMLLDSLKRFSASVLKPAAPKIDEHQKMDPALFKPAAELGMPLDAVPAKYEGYLEGAYPHLNRALRAAALAEACAGVTYLLESGIDVALALGKADAKVQDAWFPKLTGKEFATGALLGEYGGFSAKAGGPGLVLSGSQTAVLLAESASFWLVQAKGPDGSVLAIYEGKPAGAETFKISNTGFRACDAADVTLAEIALPAANILAQGVAADEIWQKLLDGSRVMTAAIGLGNAQGAVDFAQGYANDRVQFGRPIAKFQAIAQMLEESKSAIAAARLLVFSLAQRLENGENVSDAIRMAKAHAAKVGTRATIDCVQVLGGYGFVSDYPVEKAYRDNRVIETLRGRDMLDVLINIQAA